MYVVANNFIFIFKEYIIYDPYTGTIQIVKVKLDFGRVLEPLSVL